MTTLNVYNLKGEKSGTAKFETVPGQKLNIKLLIQAVNVWQSNHRRGLAKAMTRGESSKTTAKWYRQKHTGRARHGSKSAPIFVGGGVAHGPTGQQNYHRVMSKKMAHGAFVSALIAKAEQGGVMVVSGLEKLEPKTKAAINLLSKLGLSEKKVLFAPEKKAVNISRAIGNLSNVSMIPADSLNAYCVLENEAVIFTPSSIPATSKPKKRKVSK